MAREVSETQGAFQMSDPHIRVGIVAADHSDAVRNLHRQAILSCPRFRVVAEVALEDANVSADEPRQLGSVVSQGGAHQSAEQMLSAQALDDNPIDVVLIIADAERSAPLASLALAAGCHVICEAPLASDSKTIRELARQSIHVERLALVSDRLVGCEQLIFLRELIESGVLGRVGKIVVEVADNRESGFNTADFGLHSILRKAVSISDLIAVERLDHVLADTSGREAGTINGDVAQVFLRYASGARGALLAWRTHPGIELWAQARIYGASASVTWRSEEPERLWIDRADGSSAIFRGRVQEEIASEPPPPHSYARELGALANIYCGLAAAIDAPNSAIGRTQLLRTAQKAAIYEEIIEACRRSDQRGCVWESIAS
ncbi:Gfo/Idh/MocA family oxidoreductase [Consotaella aegiceratis]|uniref:Gfo/Idh/MocA family oxidoreductase n=1 Tax=Consotaella aegiceratis TaxID=3097961 RepID=UPI002F40EBB4